MGLHIKHKMLIFAVSLLALIFAGLFALTLFGLLSMQREQEATPETHYLRGEEGVVIVPGKNEKPIVIPVQPVLFEYVEVMDGCGPHYDGGECVNMRSGPGADFPIVSRLRNGIVLKVGGVVDRDGKSWYKIVFDEWIRYPDRIQGDRYISADYVRALYDEGVRDLPDGQKATTTKRIVVNRTEQMLYAYEDGILFMKTSISTGVELNPTPRGTFTIYKKTPSRYMQGPIPGISDQFWDLPGVPWNLYFSKQGAAIHGTYWHNNFGKPSSHGCVNLSPADAKRLYTWADLGAQVVVQD